eukprot:1992364-Pyramimonas_sp.AAC.1
MSGREVAYSPPPDHPRPRAEGIPRSRGELGRLMPRSRRAGRTTPRPRLLEPRRSAWGGRANRT